MTDVKGRNGGCIPLKRLRDGRALPALGLGTWMMGGDTARRVSAQDKTDVAAIRYALETGYTHIDTAEIYGDGHAEELVAEAIRPFARDTIFLASKARKGRHARDALAQALDASLKRLNTDYLDLYYLHRATPETPLEETAKALNAAVRAGKVRNVGVCNFAPARVEALQKFMDVKIFANQVHYNLAFREPETSGLLKHAEANDYFVIAWRPLRLVHRTNPQASVARNIWDKSAYPALDAVAEKTGVSNVQTALAWLLRQPNVAALIKSSQPAHLDEARDACSVTLPDDQALRLTRDFAPQFAVSDTIPLE